MALDATKGFIFYTVYGKSNPSIRRAQLDGYNEMVLVTNKLVYPFGITVDIPNERVYWIDRHKNYIDSIDYNGKLKKSLMKSETLYLSDLSFSILANFERSLYILDEDTIISIDKKNNEIKMQKIGSRIISMDILNKQRQPVGKF